MMLPVGAFGTPLAMMEDAPLGTAGISKSLLKSLLSMRSALHSGASRLVAVCKTISDHQSFKSGWVGLPGSAQ